jgi:outer membrane protein assembly factor BamA
MFPTDNPDEEFLGVRPRRVFPVAYYSNPDRFFVGIKFVIARGRIKEDPFGYEHSVQLRYSVSQNALSALYDARFKQAVGKWDLTLDAYYDWVVWTNFFGFGNETQKLNPLKYYRLSTNEYAANVGVNRIIDEHHYIDLTAYFQSIEVLNSSGPFVMDNYVSDNQYYFEHHIYASLRASYAYQDVDDYVLPTKGVMLSAGAGYTVNTYNINKSFGKYNTILQGYLPFGEDFSLAVRVGATAISGTPEFYQYASVGGPMSIRGYYRDRFWGNIGFYNENEFRYIWNMPIGRYENKMGVLILFDDGRVWYKNGSSGTLHNGYGGGIMITPLHKFTGYATYTQTPEGGLLQFKFTKLLGKIVPSRGGFW